MAIVAQFQPSPSPRPFSALKNEVAGFVKMPDDPEALNVAGNAIRSAIRHYNTKTWKWNLVYQDIVLVADGWNYDLSNQVKEPRYAELLDSNGYSVGRLRYQDPRTFLEDNYPVTAAGTPTVYTLMDHHQYGTLQVNIAPTATAIASTPTLRLWHYKRIQHPQADADNLNVPSEVEAGILWKAKAEIAMVFDPKKYELALNEHREQWKLLRADNSDEQHDWE